MCKDFSDQVINISAVNQADFCYYKKQFAKIIIAKKTLVAVASNDEMHFFEFI